MQNIVNTLCSIKGLMTKGFALAPRDLQKGGNKMNAKQKQEVIKMYAETIEAENDIKKRIRQIEKLKDMFLHHLFWSYCLQSRLFC